MANRLKALKIDFVSLIPRPANQESNFVLAKSDPTPPSQEQIIVPTPTTAEPAAISKADLDAAISAAVSQVTKSYEDKMTESAAVVEKLNKSLEETTARAQQAEIVAKAEADARETTTAIAKAIAEYPHLPGATPTEIGTLVRVFAKAGAAAEAIEKLETIFKAASEAVKTGGLFSESGSSASGLAKGEQSALEKLTVVAKELQSKDDKLTTPQAIAKASELRPDLVIADRQERGFTPAAGYRQFR